MKKFFFLLTLSFIFFTKHSMAQDTAAYPLLRIYYGVKDALIDGNTANAAAKANDFIKAANGIDYKMIAEGSLQTLIKDATVISGNTDIVKQRAAFSNLSENMFTLAEKIKMSKTEIYRQYCPMKKAYWLSNEKTIRNPYYGSSMLSCGKVVATIAVK
jgi:hypothetical protein